MIRELLRIFSVLVLLSSCVPFIDEVDVKRVADLPSASSIPISIDTLVINASQTSLKGEWHIRGNHLYYADYSLIGIWEYDSDGKLLAKHIRQGRGPGELQSPMNAVCFLPDGSLVSFDRSWRFSVFDSTMTSIVSTYRFLSEEPFDQRDWTKLRANPDPEVNQMYEFNLDSRRMCSSEEGIVIPVYTEHVFFNAFTSINHRKYWRGAYNFMIIDVKNRHLVRKIGHFPKRYHKSRIPAFYMYDFDVKNDSLYVSYAADSLVYVMNMQGENLRTFGRSIPGFTEKMPENRSFSDYSKTVLDYQSASAYYQSLKVIGTYCFRSYKMPFDQGYGLQVYQDHGLINSYRFSEEVSVIGEIDGWIYAATRADIENDVYKIYRFRI